MRTGLLTRSLLTIGLSGVALVGGALLLLTPTTGNEAKPKDQPRVVAVTRGSIQTRVAETGTLEPLLTVEIKSQFSGEIKKLFVEEGQTVRAGESLALIQQEPSQARQVAQVRASLEEEKVNVERARADYERVRTLVGRGFLAQQEAEKAQQEYARAQVRKDLADRQLLLALGGNRDLYRRYLARDLNSDRLEDFELLSPTTGTVLELKVHPGEIITSGTATFGGGTVLMTIADLTHMVVKAKVNEVNIGRVRLGQPVEVRLDAIPSRLFLGEVTAISPQGEKENSIVRYAVTVEIDNTDNTLRPLMTANVDILTEELTGVLSIPLEALRSESGDDIVYVLANGGRLPRKVRVGLRTPTHAVIMHGLEEGETVVIPTLTEKSG